VVLFLVPQVLLWVRQVDWVMVLHWVLVLVLV
jgi:hypothetical protein